MGFESEDVALSISNSTYKEAIGRPLIRIAA
jgi:hypothetical protein